jgi:hypothetical protein
VAKKSRFKPSTRTRESLPHARPTKDGGIELLCPFCTPPHPLTPGNASVCGTELRVTAVQTVISARTARLEKFTCVKCGEVGKGEMVRYFNGYLHVEECNPEMQLLTEMPKFSRVAEFVYKLPSWLSELIEDYTGIVQVVREITPEGVETGAIEGYFFHKNPKASA